ncbi:hypothetical protein MDA_GLEAN10025355 [Myotis davidii]|uniref:Uncharacterized protein n=1 Tax=Myotis davidii TaxID=225400 RepID=L5LZZ5_MYODS|nr:hypothetical protein MDA_GLEAN10025355 [Myotis davidii]
MTLSDAQLCPFTSHQLCRCPYLDPVTLCWAMTPTPV